MAETKEGGSRREEGRRGRGEGRRGRDEERREGEQDGEMYEGVGSIGGAPAPSSPLPLPPRFATIRKSCTLPRCTVQLLTHHQASRKYFFSASGNFEKNFVRESL